MLISRRRLGLAAAALALMPVTLLPAGAALAEDPDWPNVFISPFGEPFRAKLGAPYPVIDWFKKADKNSDGKLDHAEFVADATAFFKVLDVNGDGVIAPGEVEYYEHNVCPEVLGYRVQVGALPADSGARLWLAQAGYGGASGSPPISGSGDDSQDGPKGFEQDAPTGAAAFNFMEAPEPITGADTTFSGFIRQADFIAMANRRFTALDTAGVGYLTLATLPKTIAQKALEKKHGFRL
jgi:hypothetical protein